MVFRGGHEFELLSRYWLAIDFFFRIVLELEHDFLLLKIE